MKGSTEPRVAVYFGMRCGASLGEKDTWLEAEEWCYPNGGMTRRARCINTDTNKLVVVRCGIPDTYFSIPARGGYVTSKDGTFLFHPRKKAAAT